MKATVHTTFTYKKKPTTHAYHYLTLARPADDQSVLSKKLLEKKFGDQLINFHFFSLSRFSTYASKVCVSLFPLFYP